MGRILIVDDEKPLAHYLRQALLFELPESHVDLAHSGEEALSQLAHATYDLILADLRMPGFSGLELIKGVRYLHADVPIVLMTGFGSETLREQARQLNVNHYLDKPFTVQDVLAVIQQFLPESEPNNG